MLFYQLPKFCTDALDILKAICKEAVQFESISTFTLSITFVTHLELYEASTTGQIATLQQLIAEGADVNLGNELGETAMYIASKMVLLHYEYIL